MNYPSMCDSLIYFFRDYKRHLILFGFLSILSLGAIIILSGTSSRLHKYPARIFKKDGKISPDANSTETIIFNDKTSAKDSPVDLVTHSEHHHEQMRSIDGNNATIALESPLYPNDYDVNDRGDSHRSLDANLEWLRSKRHSDPARTLLQAGQSSIDEASHPVLLPLSSSSSSSSSAAAASSSSSSSDLYNEVTNRHVKLRSFNDEDLASIDGNLNSVYYSGQSLLQHPNSLKLESGEQYKHSRVLLPDLINIAVANFTKAEASSTCGLSLSHTENEMYCSLVSVSVFQPKPVIKEGLNCDYCEADPTSNKSHYIGNILLSEAFKWWMSPPLSRGLQYRQVNVTLNFSQPFEIDYIILNMANSPRPDVWILEKSMDFGESWQDWQYFTTSWDDCQQYFPQALERIEQEDSVICTHEYSGLFPLEMGEIFISLVKQRPKTNYKRFLTFTTATNIRLRFIKPKTVSGTALELEQLERPGIAKRIFYSIQSIDIVARCTCNGHADKCTTHWTNNALGHYKQVANNSTYFASTSDFGASNRYRLDAYNLHHHSANIQTLRCNCLHNTEGEHCHQCKDPFVQKRWRPAWSTSTNALHQQSTSSPYNFQLPFITGNSNNNDNLQQQSIFQCELCNCHNHSKECLYNATIDEQKLSMDIHGQMEGGGVCLNCQHNTTGINCNQCMEGFYHPLSRDWTDVEACVPCDCDKRFTTGKCDINGHCECKPEFEGRRECAECKPRYYGDNLKKTCKQCNCHWQGTSSCDSVTGACKCMINVIGERCDKCRANYFGLQLGLGCRACNCGSGSLTNQCDLVTGQCSCREGLMGRQCDQCDYNHYDYNSTLGACQRCQCDSMLSHYNEISQRNNNRIISNLAISGGGGGNNNNDSSIGLPADNDLERLCDQYNGQCSCKKNVVGLQCDRCRERHIVDQRSHDEQQNKQLVLGCKPCQGECTDELFAQLDLIRSMLDDSFRYVNRTKTNKLKMDKLISWNTKLSQYAQYLDTSRQQLTDSIKNYSKAINVSILPDDAGIVGNHAVMFNASHLTRANQQMVAFSDKLKQFHETYSLNDKLNLIDAFKQRLISGLNGIQLVKLNSFVMHENIENITNRFDRFMERFGVPQLDEGELSFTRLACRNNRNNNNSKSCLEQEVGDHEEDEVTISTMLTSFQANMNNTRDQTESVVIKSLHNLISRLSTEVNWFKGLYEHDLAETNDLRHQWIERGYIEPFRTLINDYLNANYAIVAVRASMRDYIILEDELIDYSPLLPSSGPRRVVLISLRQAQGQLFQAINKLSSFAKKINDHASMFERVTNKTTIVDDYLSSESSLGLGLNSLKLATEDNKHKKESLEEFMQFVKLEKLNKDVQNDVERWQILLEPYENYRYLLIDANATMQSLLHLYDLAQQFSGGREEFSLMSSLKRLQMCENKLIKFMKILNSNQSQSVELSTNRVNKKPLMDASKLTASMHDTLEDLREKITKLMRNDYENLNSDYHHLLNATKHLSILQANYTQSSAMFQMKSTHLSSQINYLFAMANGETMKFLRMVDSARKINHLAIQISRDKSSIKSTYVASAYKLSSLFSRNESSRLLANWSINWDAVAMQQFMDTSLTYNGNQESAKTDALATKIGKNLDSLKYQLDETRHRINRLKIGAHFNGTNCVKLRPSNNHYQNNSISIASLGTSSNDDWDMLKRQKQHEKYLNLTVMVKTSAQTGVIVFLGSPRIRNQSRHLFGSSNVATNDNDNDNKTMSPVYEDHIVLLLNRGKLVANISCNGRRVLHKETDINISDDKWHTIQFTSNLIQDNLHMEGNTTAAKTENSIRIKVINEKGEGPIVTTRLEASSDHSCVVATMMRINNDDVQTKKCPLADLYIGGAPIIKMSNARVARRSLKPKSKRISPLQDDNSLSNTINKESKPIIAYRKHDNFVGSIYGININGVDLNAWNFNTNTDMIHNINYLKESHCILQRPFPDFIPG